MVILEFRGEFSLDELGQLRVPILHGLYVSKTKFLCFDCFLGFFNCNLGIFFAVYAYEYVRVSDTFQRSLKDVVRVCSPILKRGRFQEWHPIDLIRYLSSDPAKLVNVRAYEDIELFSGRERC